MAGTGHFELSPLSPSVCTTATWGVGVAAARLNVDPVTNRWRHSPSTLVTIFNFLAAKQSHCVCFLHFHRHRHFVCVVSEGQVPGSAVAGGSDLGTPGAEEPSLEALLESGRN